MIKACTSCQRSLTFESSGWPRILPAKVFSGSWPRPMPAHECSVVPPILTDAMPVDAVIPSVDDAPPPRILMISRSNPDLPVPVANWFVNVCYHLSDCCIPAEPVKNTFLPCCTICKTLVCSGDKLNRCDVSFRKTASTSEGVEG
jgi:hypothetical protein